MRKHWFGAVLAFALAGLSSVPAMAQAHRVAEARAAVASHRQDAAASLALGRALRRAGLHQEAMHELQRGSLIAGARTGPVALDLRYELARVHMEQGSFREALHACELLKATAGGAAMGHACLGETHMTRQRASDALPEVQRALALTPGLYLATVVLGDAQWLEGRAAEAEGSFRAATQTDPGRAEAWLSLGRLMAYLNRPAEALQAMEKAYAADAEDAVVAHALASLLPSGDRAVGVLEGAIRSRPTHGPSHARLAEVLLDLGRLERAEQEARLALGTSPVEADWHAVLAEVLIRRGQFDPALAAAADALRRVPNSARGKLAEADALAAKGEIDLAIESYQAAYGFGRTQPTALVRGARACLAQGRGTTARGFAQRAVEAFPKWGPAWEVVGDIASKEGDKEKARQAYQKALQGEGPVDRARIQAALRSLPRVGIQ
jgi:tetratricopeptide (TPR) repeat protein